MATKLKKYKKLKKTTTQKKPRSNSKTSKPKKTARTTKFTQDLKKKPSRPLGPSEPPIHPWRLCPGGQHWVIEHPRKVAPSPRHPNGTTHVRAHCQMNPTRKDQFYPDEIAEIASRYFHLLLNRPNPNPLKFPNGSDYDELIAGWTQYWNDIFKVGDPLDPDLVKALIATESGFRPTIITPVPRSKENMARGLMQVTDETRKILADEKGELRDHLVNLTPEEALNPNINICAGIRWIFRKREIAVSKFGKNTTWDQVIEFYKDGKKKPAIMKIFREVYATLKNKRSV